jgi:RNA polymerase sigma factor (sigma-70 family)
VDFNDSYDGMDNSLENLLADPTMNLEDRALDHLELLQAIKQIEPKRLKPLKLLLEGFTYQEIAEQLGESLDTVRSRIFRVRQDLRRAIYQDRKAIPA